MSLRVLVLVWSLCCWGALAENENSTEPYSLRLVRGRGRCQGELQVQRRGQDWAEVKPWFQPLWFAARLCAELDCGAVLSAVKKPVPERHAVLLMSPCEGPSLINCFDFNKRPFAQSLELTCSDSLRLVSGQTSCSGSLQIWDQSLSQSWTPVCEGALDRRGAEVLCRELGCGAPLLQGALSPLGQTFLCEGHESALMDCPRNQTRTEPGTCSPLHLTCSEPLRLVDGASRCQGTVEVDFQGEWRRLTSFGFWGLKAAAAVCRGLDCGSAVYTDDTQRSSTWSKVWSAKFTCVKKNLSVRDCIEEGSSSSRTVQVECSDSVRLVGGRSLCSGSLQISDQSLAQSWTPVCEGALDRRGAEVLCRELGCGAPLLQGALSPLGQTFLCEGHESALMDCPRNQTRTEPGTCSPLHLTCSEPLRLVGGSGRCEGVVEVKHRGQWRRVLPFFDPWSLAAAAAVCRDLDCGFAVSTEHKHDLTTSDVWQAEGNCMKTAAMRDCVFSEASGLQSGLHVACSDSVRLVGGRSLCSGSLQILAQSSAQSWTPVCEGALDRRGAEVLCRELGCGAPLLQGALSPLGQTFLCEGHESALMDCPRNQTRTEPGTCFPLNLTCSEPVRLVGGASRCEGTVEVAYRGEWRRLVPLHIRWDLEVAAAVCRDVACGSVASTSERQGFNSSEVWAVRPDCVKTAAVKDCAFAAAGRTQAVDVVCSGHQGAPEKTQSLP